MAGRVRGAQRAPIPTNDTSTDLSFASTHPSLVSTHPPFASTHPWLDSTHPPFASTHPSLASTRPGEPLPRQALTQSPRVAHRLAARPLLTAVLIALVAISAHAISASPPARASNADGMKAVIVVGPGGWRTRNYLGAARIFAHQARAVGMDVRTIYSPHATWARVRPALQHANLIVYYGHGNGWPSPYGPFQERTKDGLGLNPSDGSGLDAPVAYHGADFIRKDVQFAPHAIVVLLHLCYASGNAEAEDRPMWASDASDRNLAVERVDNYAQGFLRAGAGVVFTFNWDQVYNLAKEFATTRKTMDQIFMTRSSRRYGPQAFIGKYDYYRDAKRSPGARIHLDPDNTWGHRRAITGDLGLTAEEWRGQAPPPDEQAPSISDVTSEAGGVKVPAGAADPSSFSPNGDGVADVLDIDRRLSEPSYVHVDVRDDTDTLVRSFEHWSWNGSGTTRWDGTADDGSTVPDGLYHLTLTPRDQADNVGPPVTLDARVLTTLASPAISRKAINVRDGDDLAASETFSVKLAHDANVSWKVTDRAGNLVRTHLDSEPTSAGPLSWDWDGTDQDGHAVNDGWYLGVVSAATDGGTVTYTRRLWVGPYRVTLSDGTPRRGERVGISVFATERQAGAPKVQIVQPGLSARTLTTKHVRGSHWHVTLRLSHAGKAGQLKISVLGTDTGGQAETYTHALHID